MGDPVAEAAEALMEWTCQFGDDHFVDLLDAYRKAVEHSAAEKIRAKYPEVSSG